MRNLVYALPFFALIAYAQAPDNKLDQGADNPPKDARAVFRARAEGSAGGTAQSPLSDEAKKAVGSDARPHMSFPSTGYERRVDSEGDAQSERHSEKAPDKK